MLVLNTRFVDKVQFLSLDNFFSKDEVLILKMPGYTFGQFTIH
jgi:hypothetical protein